MHPRVYLDHAATTPPAAEVLAAMSEVWASPTNPMSAHAEGRAAHAKVEQARARVAALVGWPPSCVVFTSGATEANALALADASPLWWAAAVEHPSVRAWTHVGLPVDAHGRVLEGGLADAAGAGAPGVSIQAANHETGVLQPLERLIPAARSLGLRVHVDACRAPGRLDPSVLRDADLVTLSGHKFGGPQGVGALLSRDAGGQRARARGGPQERGRRAGTHAVAGIVGFGVAALRVTRGDRCAGDVGKRSRLEDEVRALGGVVVGDGVARLPDTVYVAFPGVDAADLCFALDLEGVAASAGAACASGAAEPSAVLRAMGWLERPGLAGGAVRFSLGPDTTDADIALCVGRLARALATFRASRG